MLTLTRQAGQSIKIGDDVVIEFKSIRGGKSVVCIKAPRETRILRGELEEAQDKNLTASAPNG